LIIIKNEIDGMVLSVPTAPVLGVPSNQISKNVGTMENTGYEFSADYSIINKADLRWNVGFNLTFQKKSVTITRR
jgi:hypothetical protein